MTILDTNNKATSLRVDASGRLMVIPSGGGSTAANLAIGVRTATSLPITNSNGTGVDIPVATTALAGTLSAADKVQVDSIASKLSLTGGGLTGNLAVGSVNVSVARLLVEGGVTDAGSEAHIRINPTPGVPATLGTASSSGSLQLFGGATGAAGSTRGAQIDLTGGSNAIPGAILFRSGTATGGTSQPERMRLDEFGVLGVRIVPAAWDPAVATIQLSNSGGVWGNPNGGLYASGNLYHTSGGRRYIRNDGASEYVQASAHHIWSTAPSGVAGNVASLVERMRLDDSGNLLVGAGAGPRHMLFKNVAENAEILYVGRAGTAAPCLSVNGSSGIGGWAGALSVLYVGKNSSTSRSINAGGTVNASGADYAEYEQNNGLVIAKGAIVGFRADGTLTDAFASAIRFGIKSTDPGLVGGDTWGNADAIGPRPDPEDAVATAAYEASLEAARKNVDRVAYSGKVPVNVYGAEPGQYIVAVKAASGGIEGRAVPKGALSFSDYQDAVGRVNRILPDGRAEVAVIIH